MTKEDDLGTEYQLDFIRDNPIMAICKRRHKEPINAPSLKNVRCFWCGSEMFAIDKRAYTERLKNLWKYSVPRQLSLEVGT